MDPFTLSLISFVFILGGALFGFYLGVSCQKITCHSSAAVPAIQATTQGKREVELGALDGVVGLKVMARAADRLDRVDTFVELIDGHRKILHHHLVPVRLVAPSG
jgi:hypothetical protein